MKMLSVGKIAGLALVFMLAVLAVSLVSPAQVMAAPLNQCSSAELQYGDTTARYQLTLADQSLGEPTRDFRFVGGDSKLVPMDRCERVSHHCHFRCEDAYNRHHCYRHCMREHDCD